MCSRAFFDIVRKDNYRYTGRKFSIITFFYGFRSQGFKYLFFLRLYGVFKKNRVFRLLIKLYLRKLSYRFGFQIGGRIGAGFYIGHFGTIIVSVNSRIGENCNISPGVTIGSTKRGKSLGAPQIGNFVWIGTNSILVGNIQIGDNVLIAPGSYVNFDVPSNSIVIGNPGKVIENKNATQGYINNVLNL